jgi:aryl-alcohol dehydrogenase-like predicted oxidoreductase
MKYRLLGKSGPRVSEAALGTIRYEREISWRFHSARSPERGLSHEILQRCARQ